jgi:hypothetical protein
MVYSFDQMIQRIKELLRAVPFSPFKIKTSDGNEYAVPTADHAAIALGNSRVLVFGDDESMKTLSGLHIVAVEETTQAR